MKNGFLITFILCILPLFVFGQASTKLSKKELRKLKKIEKFEALKQSVYDSIFTLEINERVTETGQFGFSNGVVKLKKEKGSVELDYNGKAIKENSFIHVFFDLQNYKIVEEDNGATIVTSFTMTHKGAFCYMEMRTTMRRTTFVFRSGSRPERVYQGKLYAK